MVKKRRLTDLFVVGREVKFDDGHGEPLTVWLQKLNPVEHETAMRRAAGARSRVLSGKDAAETELAQDEAEQLGREGWIEYLTSDVLSRKFPAIEAELAAEEEWSKDDYLQGLRDVWDSTMKNLLEEEPEAVDAQTVRDELQRFADALEQRIDGERENIRKDFEGKDDEDLERRVVDRLIGTRADLAWLGEFRKCEVWIATRDPDNHRKRYFESREEVDDLSHPVLLRLMTEYAELNVDPQEGKDSGVIPNSSPWSDSLDEEEMAEASGQ